MPNGHWRVATLKRLGALTPPPGACCAHMNRAGQRCGQQLGADALHLDLCRHATGRLRPHTAGVQSLAQRSRRAGANVDVERCIPELAIWHSEERCVDAIMDLVTWWPGRLQQFLLDLTIRSPHASRYGITEDITGRAGQEKHRRYGEAVWAIAMTTYGRLGYEAMRALDLLAGEAKAAGGDPSTQRGLTSRWRADLERAVLHAIADQHLLALGAERCDVQKPGSRGRQAPQGGADAAAGARGLSYLQRSLADSRHAAANARELIAATPVQLPGGLPTSSLFSCGGSPPPIAPMRAP